MQQIAPLFAHLFEFMTTFKILTTIRANIRSHTVIHEDLERNEEICFKIEVYVSLYKKP